MKKYSDPLQNSTDWRSAKIKVTDGEGFVTEMNAGDAYDTVMRKVNAAKKLIEIQNATTEQG